MDEDISRLHGELGLKCLATEGTWEERTMDGLVEILLGRKLEAFDAVSLLLLSRGKLSSSLTLMMMLGIFNMFSNMVW